MRMGKKIKEFLIIVTVIGTVVLSGCGGNDDTEQSQGQQESSSQQNTNATPKPTVTSTPVIEEENIPDDSNKEESEEVEEETTKEESAQLEGQSNDTTPVIGEVDPTIAQEIVYVSTNGVELPEGAAMSIDMFSETYGISTEGISSYYIHIPIKNLYATEIAVFEVENENAKSEVLKGIEKRQQQLLKQFKDISEEYTLVENYRVEEKDNTIIFVISKEADKIVEQFLSL